MHKSYLAITFSWMMNKLQAVREAARGAVREAVVGKKRDGDLTQDVKGERKRTIIYNTHHVYM